MRNCILGEVRWVVLTVAIVVAGTTSAVAQEKPAAGEKPGVPVWCLDVTQDGSLLVAAGGNRGASDRGVLQVWDTRDWSVALRMWENRAATCAAISPDQSQLAVGTQIGEVLIVDLAAKKIVKRWPTGQWAVFGITWTPNGSDVIAACASGVIKIWNAQSGALKSTLDTWQADGTNNPMLTGHGDRNIWDVTVSSDGKTLLSAGWNDTTRVWDLQNGALQQEFFETDSSTQGVKFTPDEKFFVSVGINGNAFIRETETLHVRMTLPVSGRDISVHPQGEWIAVATLEDVQVFKVNLKRSKDAQAARYQKLIAQLGDADGTVRDAASAELESIGAPAEPYLFDALDATNVETRTRARRLWEKRSVPIPSFTLAGHRGEVRQVVFSPNGKFLASSTLEGEVRVWDTDQFQQQHVFNVTLPE
jgi:WD40 repeat protein